MFCHLPLQFLVPLSISLLSYPSYCCFTQKDGRLSPFRESNPCLHPRKFVFLYAIHLHCSKPFLVVFSSASTSLAIPPPTTTTSPHPHHLLEFLAHRIDDSSLLFVYISNSGSSLSTGRLSEPTWGLLGRRIRLITTSLQIISSGQPSQDVVQPYEAPIHWQATKQPARISSTSSFAEGADGHWAHQGQLCYSSSSTCRSSLVTKS